MSAEEDEDEAVADITTVPAAATLTDQIFAKHMDLRHMPMGGMTHLYWRPGQLIEYIRAYHDRCHAIAVPFGIVNAHDHQEVQR